MNDKSIIDSLKWIATISIIAIPIEGIIWYWYSGLWRLMIGTTLLWLITSIFVIGAEKKYKKDADANR